MNRMIISYNNIILLHLIQFVQQIGEFQNKPNFIT